MELLVICDIDETVANNLHRHHLVECETPDWRAFLAPELVAKDTLIPGAYEGLKHLQALGAEIIFLTGRNVTLRETTDKWLRENMPELRGWRLITRTLDDDGTTATSFKTKALRKLRRDEPVQAYRRWLCFDDDKYLWPVYRELFNAIVFRAPHCWEHLFPSAGELPEEANWRR